MKHYHNLKKRIFSIFLAALIVLSPCLTTPLNAFGTSTASLTGAGTREDPYVIFAASDFPTEIPADTYYCLGADITLSENQQIATLAGVFDGKGHTITLSNLPLAGSVSGTIQNLGVTGSTIIESASTFGSMAVTLTGIIQNCYSTASLKLNGWMGEVGGLVGTINGGRIYNSYFAGTISSMMFGGLAGENDSSASGLYNSYSSSGNGVISFNMASDAPVENCEILDPSDFTSGVLTKKLNTGLPATGYIWITPDPSINSGMPVLQAGDASDIPVDHQALKNAIAQAEAKNASDYTEDSWTALKQALDSGKQTDNDPSASQAEVDAAAETLTKALAALVKKKPTEPVPLPGTGITYISSVSDLESIPSDNKGQYYVLTQDITISQSDWYFSFISFNGVLDGQGHSIIFDNPSSSLFTDIGEEGVIQNLQLKGTLSNKSPLGTTMKGAVLNVSTSVEATGGSGYPGAGLANTLSGGIVSNCYSISPAANGPFFNRYESGLLRNTYWQEGLTNTSIPDSALQYSYPKSDSYMQSLDFVALLNQNKGSNGTAWGRSSDGYPYFGPDQEPAAGGPVLPANKCRIAFTPFNSSEAILIEDQQLSVSPDLVDGFQIAGSFSLPDYPLQPGEHIEWSCTDSSNLQIGSEIGNLRVNANGTTVIQATVCRADGSTELLASVYVTARQEKMTGLRLFIDGTDVTNAAFTVEGSEEKRIRVQAQFDGSSEYVDTASSSFIYEAADTDRIYSTPSSSAFYFLEPGTSTITVTSKSNPNLSATITLTSDYVPALSIRPSVAGTVILHGRNANSDGGRAFLPDYSAVIVEPENASYRNNWTITSSNPSVASYVSSMVKGYVPYKAGTTTYTATLTDKAPSGSINTLTGTSTVTYRYQNPLTAVTATETNLTLQNGDILPLDLAYTGAEPASDYSVTEPELIWTYSQNGIVRIARKENGYWKRNTTAKDNNMYIASADYSIYAESEGTVIATGTPVDTTAGAEPVILTITVTKGNLTPVDTDRLLQSGIENARRAITDAYASYGYHYGDEWAVYAILRSGGTISPQESNAYYQDVVQTVSTWTSRQKPTDIERVALTLSLLGKDITNIEGRNLAAMIYEHPDLDAGSNELIFALLALDARSTPIPADARWSRERIAAALLTFQNPDTGGFGLYDAASTGDIDLTAMAIQALASYAETDSTIALSVEKAWDFLRQNLTPEYGYLTPEAGAQTLIALAVSGFDLQAAGFGTPYRNLVSQLSAYVPASVSTGMSTLQILQAFEAYRRYRTGELSYWKHQAPITDQEQQALVPGTAPDQNPGAAATPLTGDERWLYLAFLLASASFLGILGLLKQKRCRW